MTEREMYEKFGELSNNELDKLCNKSVLLAILSWQILIIVEVKKRETDGFRRQLMPDHQISESIEHKVKSKIGTIFVNEDILEEYSVRIYEIDLYFSEN